MEPKKQTQEEAKVQQLKQAYNNARVEYDLAGDAINKAVARKRHHERELYRLATELVAELQPELPFQNEAQDASAKPKPIGGKGQGIGK